MTKRIIDILAISIGLFILTVLLLWLGVHIVDNPIAFVIVSGFGVGMYSVSKAFVWLMEKYYDS
jgi:hypothetical protein